MCPILHTDVSHGPLFFCLTTSLSHKWRLMRPQTDLGVGRGSVWGEKDKPPEMIWKWLENIKEISLCCCFSGSGCGLGEGSHLPAEGCMLWVSYWGQRSEHLKLILYQFAQMWVTEGRVSSRPKSWRQASKKESDLLFQLLTYWNSWNLKITSNADKGVGKRITHL